MAKPTLGNDTERILQLERDVQELRENNRKLEGQIARTFQVPAMRLFKTVEETTYPTTDERVVAGVFSNSTFTREEDASDNTITDRGTPSDTLEYFYNLAGERMLEGKYGVAFRLQDRWFTWHNEIHEGTLDEIDDVGTEIIGTVDIGSDSVEAKNKSGQIVFHKATCLVAWDIGNTEWAIIASNTPTMLAGHLKGDMTTSQAQKEVTVTTDSARLRGNMTQDWIDENPTVTAINRASAENPGERIFEGNDGAACMVVWKPAEGLWEFIYVECPDSTVTDADASGARFTAAISAASSTATFNPALIDSISSDHSPQDVIQGAG